MSEDDEDDPSMQDQKETQIQVEKETPPSNGNLETSDG